MKSTTSIILAAATLALIAAASPASAETNLEVRAGARINASGTNPVRGEIKDMRDIKKTGRETVAQIKASSTLATSSLRDALKENRKGTIEALKTNREELKFAIETRRKELKDRINKMVTAKKKRLETKSQEVVIRRITNIFNELDQRVARLDSVDQKIADRINVSSEIGVNISSSTALYIAAQASLVKTKTEVEAARVAALAEATTDTSKEAIGELLRTAKESIKTTTETYRKVLQSLKIEIPKVETTSSTTVDAQI